MNLKKILTLDRIMLGLTEKDKNSVIETLVDSIVANSPELDKQTLLKAVLDRESQMSTGMKNGIAIPHGKTDAVSTLHVAIALSAQPIEFNSLDQKGAQIFIMTISPVSQPGPHLEFLAEISNLLTKDATRSRILQARTKIELLEAFLENDS